MVAQRYYSQIYWHFTGGPRIPKDQVVYKPDDARKFGLKSDQEAFKTAQDILESGVLQAKAVESWNGINTDNFSCVTDIPLKDLPYHAQYYGKTALGFSSKAIHETWFPVFYVPGDNLKVLNELSGMLDFLMDYIKEDRPAINEKPSPPSELKIFRIISRSIHRQHPDTPEDEVYQALIDRATTEKKILAESRRYEINSLLTISTRFQQRYKKNVLNWIKITNFGDGEGESFYQEREWRHIGDFAFASDAVTTWVVPSPYVPEAKLFLSQQNMDHVSVIGWNVIEEG